MILFKKSGDLAKWLESQRKNQKKIGFVPTMGALHAGHLTLITESRKLNDLTVCSIFVNPTQFNEKADFDKYPITIEKDISQLLETENDVLFLPDQKEIYPSEPVNERYDLGYLETVLEGEFRPGHFQGVCMVVKRLLDIVEPDNLYLGQKDYQQCMVIRRLVEIMGMQDKIAVRECPTLREHDGLAMSSRNMRLNEKERLQAASIYQTLEFLKNNIKPGNLDALKKQAITILINNGFKPDYVEIADATTLELLNEWDGKRKIVFLVAAFLNEIRLIDNMVL